MKPEDLLFMGLALIAGIGIGVALMTLIRPQTTSVVYQATQPANVVEKPKFYVIDRPVQQPPAQMTERVSNAETMTVQRGEDGEFLGYTIHRDVQSK